MLGPSPGEKGALRIAKRIVLHDPEGIVIHPNTEMFVVQVAEFEGLEIEARHIFL
jgi:hypothetical protein